MEPLRLGLVGVGAIAQSYGQAMQQMKDVRLVGVADVRLEAARSMGEAFSCPSYESHDALLDKGNLDAIIVCTPPSTHLEITEGALNKKIHVLCEKPLSTDSASAKRMIDCSHKNGRVLTMASKFRFVGDVIKAKNIVTSGILGDVILFENAFTSRVNMAQRWNANPKISGGGVLIDNGTHSVDLIRYFLGPIDEVQAVEGKRVQALEVEDTVRLFIHSEEGVMGSIDLSWTLNKELDSFIDIYGSNGTIRVGWKQSKYRQSSSQDWVVFGNGYNKVEAFVRQLENFRDAVRGVDDPRLSLDDALASVQVIEAAYKSMSSNNWTKVNDPRSSRVPPPPKAK